MRRRATRRRRLAMSDYSRHARRPRPYSRHARRRCRYSRHARRQSRLSTGSQEALTNIPQGAVAEYFILRANAAVFMYM